MRGGCPSVTWEGDTRKSIDIGVEGQLRSGNEFGYTRVGLLYL